MAYDESLFKVESANYGLNLFRNISMESLGDLVDDDTVSTVHGSAYITEVYTYCYLHICLESVDEICRVFRNIL